MLLVGSGLGGGVLDPHGPIGVSERLILFDSLAVMLAIVVPVILATLAFAWWFRASNRRAIQLPDWSFSGTLELIIWAVPAIVITFLGGIAWFGSQALDPYRPLGSKPIEVQVVSLDWKWLFLYPNDAIATVNQLVLPVGSPVHFRLTSGGVMNSFFIPQLGSQVYTMARMVSQLSLQADAPGIYRGFSAQFSGAGFAGMHFDVRAVPPAAYREWIADSKRSVRVLDAAAYAALAQPGVGVEPGTYRTDDPGLFEAIASQGAPVPGHHEAPRAQEPPSRRTGS